jgi:hypothetical protein
MTGLTGLSLAVHIGLAYHPLLTNLPLGLRVDVHCLFDPMRVGVVRQPQILPLSITFDCHMVRSREQKTVYWTNLCTEVRLHNVADLDLLQGRDHVSLTT